MVSGVISRSFARNTERRSRATFTFLASGLFSRLAGLGLRFDSEGCASTSDSSSKREDHVQTYFLQQATVPPLFNTEDRGLWKNYRKEIRWVPRLEVTAQTFTVSLVSFGFRSGYHGIATTEVSNPLRHPRLLKRGKITH